MARSIYSERFLAAYGPNNIWTYAVPAGKRAVIRSIVLSSNGGSTGQVWVAGAGRFFLQRVLPAQVQTVSEDVRIVLYGGEGIELYVAAAGHYVWVCGYLFDDPGGELAIASVAVRDAPAGRDAMPDLEA